MNTANATFVNERYEPETYDDRDGTALGRTQIERRFEGDIEGSATAELLTATVADGSAAYVALDRVQGALHGRRGSFVLHHRGIVSAAGAAVDGGVVPGSGTGELAGLSGSLTISADADGTHRLKLDYELEPVPDAAS